MKKTEPYQGFEQGPIRPPSEANSLLIRITRNCPWNRCTFCPVYKKSAFSLRPLEHVLQDIDRVHFYVMAILSDRQQGSSPSRRDYMSLSPPFSEGDTGDMLALHAAYSFVASGMKSVFIQDGNSLIIKPDDIVHILSHIKQSFPSVVRITSYARSQTIARISDENLQRMADAGLNRIHIGMESGSDSVLELVKKGTDKATHVRAGQKVKRAGIALSEYYMPGLGGRRFSTEHARESADALNQINPDYIRLRTLALPADAPLTRAAEAGDFLKMGEVETARELLLFLESLQGITSRIKSDHVLNLFQEVEGILPEDQERMIAPVRTFLGLSPEEQMIFSMGRRTHCMARLTDLENPRLYDFTKQACRELGVTPGNLDATIESVIKKFI